MINKALRLKALNSSVLEEINAWSDEVKFSVNDKIITLDIPVSKSGLIVNHVKGKHPAKNLTTVAPDNKAYFGFVVPYSLRAFKEVTIRFIANTTGTINYTVNVAWGSVGAAYNANSATASATGVSVTDALISEINITSLFADQKLNDQVGVEFVLDSLTTTTSLDVLSLYIKHK